MTTLITQPAPAAIESPATYSLWSDPLFWAFCELLADECIRLNQPAQLRCATSENP